MNTLRVIICDPGPSGYSGSDATPLQRIKARAAAIRPHLDEPGLLVVRDRPDLSDFCISKLVPAIIENSIP